MTSQGFSHEVTHTYDVILNLKSVRRSGKWHSGWMKKTFFNKGGGFRPVNKEFTVKMNIQTFSYVLKTSASKYHALE